MSNTVATLGVDITVTERTPRALEAFEKKLQELDRTGKQTGKSLAQSLAAAGNTGPAAAGLDRLASSARNTTSGATTATSAVERLRSAMASSAGPADGLRSALDGIGSSGGKLSGLASGAASLAGAFTGGAVAGAIADAVKQVGQFVVGLAQASLELEKTERVTRAVAGSQQKYAEIVEVARKQQALFGGTLQQNISDLGGLAMVSRSAGADLEQVVNIAQRLGTLDTAQGVQGATTALREALSGNPASLAARFELPRAALAALRDESLTTAEKMQVLDDVLNKAGISSELVASSVPEGTRAFNALSAAADDLATRIGGVFAEVPKFFGQLIIAAEDAQTSVGNISITPQVDYAAYIAQLDAIKAKTLETFAGDPAAQAWVAQTSALQALTPAQYGYVQALIAQGVAQEQAIAAATGATGALEAYNAVSATARNQGVEFVDQLNQLGPAFLSAASGGAENAAAAELLVRQWQAGELTFGQVSAALNELSAANLQQAGAAYEAEAATRAKAAADEQAASAAAEHQQRIDEARAALVEETTAKLNSAAAAQNLASFQATLANLAGGVTSGFYSNEQAARILAQSYNIAYAEALKLISAQAALGQSDGRVAAIKGPASSGGPNGFGVTASDEQVKKIQAAKQAKRDYEKATGDAATKQRILNEEVRIAEQRYGKYAQETYRARQAAEQNAQATERAAAAEAKRNAKSGGKGGSGSKSKGGATSPAAKEEQKRLADQQRLNNQLFADQQKADDRAEKAERDTMRRRLDIFKEFAEKRKQAERSLADSMLDSRASFYRQVIDLEDADLQQQSSAAYEKAVQDAAAIEQEKGADVAEQYLAEQEKIIAARAQREQEIRNLEEEGNAARAEALRGVDALERQAEDRRIARILEGQDSLRAQQESALSEEAANYSTKQDEMSTAAEQAAARRIASHQQAGKEIDAERVKVEALQAAYAKAAASGRPATSANTAPMVDPASVTPPRAENVNAGTVVMLNSEQFQELKESIRRVESAERYGSQQIVYAVGNAGSHVR